MTIVMQSMAQAAIEERTSTSEGMLRRAFGRLIEARWRSAERAAAAYLQGQSDKRLADLGFSAADIASLRVDGPVHGALARE